AGRFGRENDWDAGADTARSPLMTCADMLAWRDHGHEIGSHTLDHVALSHVPAHVAEVQIIESKRRLEAFGGQPVESFCYPYGDLDSRVRDQVAAAGYGN
ncbi:polysaccharide deacetylase family protein, partial [Burkholderia contaminans]